MANLSYPLLKYSFLIRGFAFRLRNFVSCAAKNAVIFFLPFVGKEMKSLTRQTLTKILDFIEGNPRNKLVILSSFEGSEISPLNVGLQFGYKLKELKRGKFFALEAREILDELLDISIVAHPQLGSCLALHNLGILLEPELKIDLSRLLENRSINHPLIIEWKGEVRDRQLYFFSPKDRIEINLKQDTIFIP